MPPPDPPIPPPGPVPVVPPVVPDMPLPVAPLPDEPAPYGALPMPLPVVGPDPIVFPEVPPTDGFRFNPGFAWPRCCVMPPIDPEPGAVAPLFVEPLLVLPVPVVPLVPADPDPVWAMAAPPNSKAMAEIHTRFAIGMIFSCRHRDFRGAARREA